MDACVLCLNNESKMLDRINANSLLWQKENIENLIKTHILSAITFTISDWVCIYCWDILDSFHKFYLRVKEAHNFFESARIKPTCESCDASQAHNVGLNYCDESKNESSESIVENEILIEQPFFTEGVTDNENPLIKAETVHTENVLMEKRRKRGRPPKDRKGEQKQKKDLLKKRNKSMIKKSLSTKNKVVFNSHEKKSINSDESAALESSGELIPAFDNNDNSDYDTEYDNDDEKKSGETNRKKRKNPDEKTRQEHDKTIAEYFKIFCSICQIPVDNFIALRKHFREEHKRRGFVICCKKKIFTRPILVDHIRFHLDPNFFKCGLCGKVYSDRCTLDSHLKIHEDGQQQRHHVCDICGKSFVGSTQLQTHKLTHAPDYEKKFSCSECGKFFTTLYSLNYHVQAIHHNKYVKICDICGKTMRCRNSFKLHMEKHDSKLAAPIHCDICGLRLTDRRGLRRHKNSQHPPGGKKEYSCNVCSKISPNPRALRTHIRFAHETGFIHKCTMCEKAFKRAEALKEHLATHTGTPLYTCPWCPKTFISNGNMHNHRKKSHPKEWEEAQRQKYGGMFLPSNVQTNEKGN